MMNPPTEGRPFLGFGGSGAETQFPYSPGFSHTGPSQGRVASPHPTPLPKQPRGRWFVALLILVGVGYGTHTIWQSYFRYQAYGVISGRVIEVSPPWDGALQYTHVHEGESVYQSQMLATLDNVELRQRLSQLADDLRVAQATLEAEVSKLKWQYIFNLDQGRGAVVNYIEAMASFLQEQARLEELQSGYERALTLANRRAMSAEELERFRFGFKGQKEKVAKLKEGLAALEKRA